MVYIHNRVAKATSYEITEHARQAHHGHCRNQGCEHGSQAHRTNTQLLRRRCLCGLPLGQIGKFGAVTRTESFVLTDDILQKAYGAEIPPYLEPTGNPAWTPDYPAEFQTLLPRRAGYVFHAGSADPSDPRGYFVNTRPAAL